MNFLLDTHTLLWVISEKEKLSNQVIQTFGNPVNSFSASAISFWEISLKFSLGKLSVQGILPEDMPGLTVQSGFKIISLSAEETSSYHRLIKTSHKDPFDRMLIWQAIQRNLTFIAKDDDFNLYKIAGLKTLR